MRDAEGYDFLSDVVTADWLGYGGDVAGYWGTSAFGGRDMNRAGSWGNAAVPKPLGDKRFTVSHATSLKLLTVAPGEHRRVRMQTWRRRRRAAIAVADPGLPVRRLPRARGLRHDGHRLRPGTRTSSASCFPTTGKATRIARTRPLGGEPVQFSDEV